jgi:hypothetical protein
VLSSTVPLTSPAPPLTAIYRRCVIRPRPNAYSTRPLAIRLIRKPQVINTDKARFYGAAIAAVKAEGTLHQRCRHRPSNIEQHPGAGSSNDQTTVKAKQSFREFRAARIVSLISCSIWRSETSPLSYSRDLLGHRFQSCSTLPFGDTTRKPP